MQTQVQDLKNQLSSHAKLVIFLARRIVKQSKIQSATSGSRFEGEITKLAKEDLTLVGLVGIVDLPYDEIPGVIRTLHNH